MKTILVLPLSVLSAAALVTGGCSDGAFGPTDAVGTWELRTFNGGVIPGTVWVRLRGDSDQVGIDAGQLTFGTGSRCTWTVDKEYDEPYSVYECSYVLGSHRAVRIALPVVMLEGRGDGDQLILADQDENVLDFRRVSETAPTNLPSTEPDFERQLEPGEYQVSVTGDIKRGFEGTGATMYQPGDPPFTGYNRVVAYMMGNSDALDGATFDICEVPLPQGTYVFDVQEPFSSCPSDSGRAAGGFIFQIGVVPQIDELNCYGWRRDTFAGVLSITSVTASEIEGEAWGEGKCTRDSHSDIGPTGSAVVSARLRFRAIRERLVTELHHRD